MSYNINQILTEFGGSEAAVSSLGAYLKIRSASPQLIDQLEHLVKALASCYDEYQDGSDIYGDELPDGAGWSKQLLRARLHLRFLIESLDSIGLVKAPYWPVIDELLRLSAPYGTNGPSKGGSSEAESK